jgi:hypothetical protein
MTDRSRSQSVDADAVRELMIAIHNGLAQEAAAVKIGLAVWRRAADRGDLSAAATAISAVDARLEALFNEIASVERRGREILGEARPRV